MPGIVWLASYPKSGNTWVRAFLANYQNDAKAAVPINLLPSFSLGDNFLSHYEKYSGKPASSLTMEELEALRPKVHEWFAYSRPDNTFVKTHSAVLKVAGRPLITPSATAGAIYVVRNPLDVAVSFAHHYQVSYERAVEALCDERYSLPRTDEQLEQVLSSWSRHVRSWTTAPGLPLHLMRYEDMRRKPAKAFAGLVRFLRLPADHDRLDRAIRFSSFRELQAQEKREKFVESRPDGKAAFFRQGAVGGWRHHLSEELAERLIEANRAVMTELGYMTAAGKLRS
ncbi:MAG: sulfotransferase domain-containing protein [Kiloniellales bacterium]